MQSVSVLPLHGGHAPKWLFPRMVKLSETICNAIINEYGEAELIHRLADPYWFQALSCAIGYDWHSSGTTTVTMGALKEALNCNSNIFIAGGKGKQGTATPEQIESGADYLSVQSSAEKYKSYSRTIAKVDSTLVYDNISIYHHTFVFSKSGEWCVVQQAMQNNGSNAVRFQTSSQSSNPSDFTSEPNSSVVSQLHSKSMDLTFTKNDSIKNASLDMVNEDIRKILDFNPKEYKLPARHEILQNIDITKRGREMLSYANEMQPQSYQELLGIKGIGRKTLRSLALLSTLIYEKEVAYRDPIIYSYNVGGKDGIPYEINLGEYDKVISSMKELVASAELPENESRKALLRLSVELRTKYKEKLG